MPIDYALFENKLSGPSKNYIARVRKADSANLDAIVKRILKQGSTSTEADIYAVLEDMMKACESILIEGRRVNLGGLIQLFPRIKGVFDSFNDTFDPERHQIDVGANPGSRLRKAVRDRARAVKVESILPAPAPLEYVDLGSGETNATITLSNIGTLNGYRLKFDPAQADEGVFLIPIGGGVEIKISTLQKNRPSQLVFLIPEGLAVGEYLLEVRARMKNSTELRSGRLGATLTV